MAEWLKRGADKEATVAADRRVCETVEAILADIAVRGDAAARGLSARFDGWEREDDRLTPAETDAGMAGLTGRDLDDIAFAQAQVCNVAQHQRAALRDIEKETLPGVVLEHRNIPVNAAGSFAPVSRPNPPARAQLPKGSGASRSQRVPVLKQGGKALALPTSRQGHHQGARA